MILDCLFTRCATFEPSKTNECKQDMRDISNLMNPSSPERLHNSNVFKKLSTSPSKSYPNDLSKPPVRISPTKKDTNKTGIQLTPKRLSSPDCLKNYAPKITQSMDRPHFEKHGGNLKIESDGSVTSLVFPASPTKVTFSNEKKVGGDGSLSKLRSRFANGLLSPQRTSQLPKSELNARNLLTKLEEDEHLETDNATSSPKRGLDEVSGPTNKRRQIKKSVKFQLPASVENENLKRQVQELRSTLARVLERQKDLEVRLKLVESQQYDKNKP